MQQLATPDQMKAIDSYMIKEKGIPGILLMENAAAYVSGAAAQAGEPVLVVCGTGNNGGDGLAAARQLLSIGVATHVLLLGGPERLTADSNINYEFFRKNDSYLTIAMDEAAVDNAFMEYGAPVIVDAIFGTGLRRTVSGVYARAISHINSSGAHVISVDIPSGVDGLTGQIMGCAVKAHETVTFQYCKLGHFIYPGAEYVGHLSLYKIGVDEGCPTVKGMTLKVCENNDPDLIIEDRPRYCNKGDFGTVTIYGGSCGMAGAVTLSAKAAVATGAGKTKVGSCSFVVSALQSTIPEVMCTKLGNEPDYIDETAAERAESMARTSSVAVLGPGMGLKKASAVMLKRILEFGIPKIVDADAINMIAADPTLMENRKGDLILTPHPKEMARLTGIQLRDILDDPMECAVNYAFKLNAIIVLKGASTIVADKSGSAVIVPQGSSGMAKGGSGDVLTGIIAALVAQGYEPYDAAVAGAYINGVAGELAAAEKGVFAMTPADTVANIGQAIAQMLHEHDDCCEDDEESEVSLLEKAFDGNTWRKQKTEPSKEQQKKPLDEEKQQNVEPVEWKALRRIKPITGF